MPIPLKLKEKLENKTYSEPTLNLRGRHITDADMPDLCRLIKDNPIIGYLDIRTNEITEIGAMHLVNLQIEILNISQNNLSSASMISILNNNPNLCLLIANDCCLNDEIVPAFLGHSNIRAVEIEDNGLSNDSLKTISEHAKSNRKKFSENKVSTLVSSVADFTDEDKMRIIEGIAEGLRTVRLSYKVDHRVNGVTPKLAHDKPLPAKYRDHSLSGE
jgi:hypothetical protein